MQAWQEEVERARQGQRDAEGKLSSLEASVICLLPYNFLIPFNFLHSDPFPLIKGGRSGFDLRICGGSQIVLLIVIWKTTKPLSHLNCDQPNGSFLIDKKGNLKLFSFFFLFLPADVLI